MKSNPHDTKQQSSRSSSADNDDGGSDATTCALCDWFAEAHFWEVTDFTIVTTMSLCGKCADLKLPTPTPDDRPRQRAPTGEIGIDLMRVGIINESNQAAILLREIGGPRYFAVMASESDARSLIDAMKGQKSEQPTVHFAWSSAFAVIKSEIVRVNIYDLRSDVYYVNLHIAGGNCESEIEIKLTDALLLAAWTKAPLYISENVLTLAMANTRNEKPEVIVAESPKPTEVKNDTAASGYDFAGKDREVVSIVMRYHSSLKPHGLVAVQLKSMTMLHERLREMSAKPEQVVHDPDTGIIYSIHESETQMLFAQMMADKLIRDSFNAYRSLLPPTLRVHQLPIEHVGALATIDSSAFAGCAESEADDFIALSSGVLRLELWATVIARIHGAKIFEKTRDSEVERQPVAWWKSSLAALAMDLMGWPSDNARSALLTGWHTVVEVNEDARINFKGALEGFMCFHEVGHFELHHGESHRQLKLKGELTPEQYYLMEYEADHFAAEHLLRIFQRPEFLGSMFAFLFALYASEPTLLQRYPLCEDAETHPHPLTRLVWLLRDLFPEDGARQAKYVRLATSIIIDVIKEMGGVPFGDAGIQDDELETLILSATFNKPDAAKLRFEDGGNEVITNQFRVIEAKKMAARRKQSGD